MHATTYLLLFSLAVGAASASGAANPATQPATTQATNEGGAVLLIHPQQIEVQSGDPVLMTLTVQNRGNQPVELSFDIYTVAYGITVVAPDGKPAPPSRFSTGSRFQVGSTVGHKLPPETESSYLCRVSAAFDLTEPGKYTVKATADVYNRIKRQKALLTAEAQIMVKAPRTSSYTAPSAIPQRHDTGTD